MISLKEAVEQAQKKQIAIPHFNFSENVTLGAVFAAAHELSEKAGYQIPLLVALSEGERDAFGTVEGVKLVQTMREHYEYPIFINADHTKSVEKAKLAIDAGFDAVIIDAADKSFEENLAMTKEVVAYARASNNKDVLIEAELGYIGSGSEVRDALPEGAAITEATITQVEEARRFVSETGIDLFAPAVGNVHGMLKNSPDPHLFINRVKEIFESTGTPLVLHGGSGTPDEDFVKAIDAGVAIVHISTELRKAWRQGVEKGLQEKPNEVAPYKLLVPAFEAVKQAAAARIKLFTKL